MKEASLAGWVACCLAVATVLFWAIASPTEGQQISIVEGATVVDSTGKRVGTLQDRKSVFIKLDDHSLVAALIGKDGFVAAGLAYSSADCSGTPYAFARQTEDGIPLLVPVAAVGPPGTTVYAKRGNTTNMTVMSYLSDGYCQSSGYDQDVVPVVPLLDLNTQFTPPFHAVQAGNGSASSCCADCDGNGRVTVNELITGVNFALNGCPASAISAQK